MASIYHKGDDPRIWLRYKDSTGTWRGKPTSYRWSNIGELRQARLLAERAAEREAELLGGDSTLFSQWVSVWLGTKYGEAKTTTPARYNRSWRVVTRFLAANGIHAAAQVKREFIDEYLRWRKDTAGRNTAIGEVKLMSMVLSEAVRRGHCAFNPLAKPGLRKSAAKEKKVWTDTDLGKAATHIEKHESHWMRAVLYMGMYQACRLRQCAVPLDRIRFDLGVIQYPDMIVKGGEGFAQPIDPRFRPILKRLVEQAQKLGFKNLCEIPWDATLRLRRTFDRAGLPGLSHHGLRVTWITRAAEAGVPESQAMAFCHHASREVHRVYKKLSAIGIAHVPAAVALPSFHVDAVAETDSRVAIGGSGAASSRGQTRTRSRG